MSSAESTIADVFDALSAVLFRVASRLTPATAPGFFAELGLPLTAAQAATLSGSFSAVTSAIEKLATTRFDLDGSVSLGNSGAVSLKSVTALGDLAATLQSLLQLAQGIAALNLPGVTPAVIDQLPARVLNYLVVDYLQGFTGLNEVLEFTGILERVDVNVGSVDPNNPFYTLNTFHLDKLTGWLKSPPAQLQALYDWGTPGFDGTKLFAMLDRLAAQLGLPVLLDTSGAAPVLDLVEVVLTPKPQGLSIRFDNNAAKGSTELAGPGWTLTAAAGLDIASGTEFLLQPDGTIKATSADALNTSGQVSLTFARTPDDGPISIISIPGASSVTAKTFSASTGLHLNWSGTSADASFSVGANVAGGSVVIDTSDGDGFLSKILSGIHVETNFDLGIDYTKDGLQFQGSSALAIQLPIHVSLGPVDITALTLSVGVESGSFPTSVSVDLKGSLGPLEAVIEAMGLTASIALANNNSGNLGPLDLASPSSRRRASACRSTPASSRAAAICPSTPTAASMPARCSWSSPISSR